MTVKEIVDRFFVFDLGQKEFYGYDTKEEAKEYIDESLLNGASIGDFKVVAGRQLGMLKVVEFIELDE